MPRQAYLFAGFAVEAVHTLFTFAILVFGVLWLPKRTLYGLIGITVVLQTIWRGCPMSQLSSELFKRSNHELSRPAFTVYLYQRFGRIVGIPILLFFLGISFFVRNIHNLSGTKK